MNKYVKRGLWGILVGFVLATILFITLPMWSPQSCLDCTVGIMTQAIIYFGFIVAWPVALMDISMVSVLLSTVYWFILGILIGILNEKRIKLLKNEK